MLGEDAELLPHPTRVGIYGASGTGKTALTLKILEDPRVKVDRVIWCCPSYSAKQPELQKLTTQGYIGRKKDGKSFLLVPAVEGWEDQLEAAIAEGEDSAGKPERRQIVVIDDLIGSMKGGRAAKVFNELFTGGRHRNLTTIELLQRIFVGAEGRLHRINCPLHIVFSLGARDEARTLFKQAAPENWRELAAAYEDIVRADPHGFVMIDQHHHAKFPDLRFRTKDLETCLMLPPPEKKGSRAKKAAPEPAEEA